MLQLTETSKDHSWLSFFNRVFGLQGWIYRDYESVTSRADFRTTEDYKSDLKEVRDLIANGRMDHSMGATIEKRMVTVRMPKELHDQIKVRAHEEQISLNKFCIQRLIS